MDAISGDRAVAQPPPPDSSRPSALSGSDGGSQDDLRQRLGLRSRDEQAWATGAACRGLDPRIFYPETRAHDRAAALGRAKAVCFGCRVWRECLNYALDHDIDEGVWGGLSAEERAAAPRGTRARLDGSAVLRPGVHP